MANKISIILDKKRSDLPEKTWSLESAERVFFGKESPTPYEEWRVAGEYIIKHGGPVRAHYVKKIFKR